ncbi:unnamed protein product [Vitrella brassicaformis CCMP3155]|uniref:Uncharacterized protein n=1 Tax=Vitrella brassicaformis (strain CCMP3155) TaxID=1169540 RepID=A0A0G4E9D8_VITBC|nr:unnamed protein product [Vitrella brassicaformis CCMP3155]|eukprot:CEL92206.1 unnamed protein product [Vitrella brassicaformis CCMP3155]
MSGPAPSGSPLAAAFAQAASPPAGQPVSVRDALGQQQQGGEGEMTQSQLVRLGRTTTPAGQVQTGTRRVEVEVPVYSDVHYEDVVAERQVPVYTQKIVPKPEVHEVVRQVPELSHSWIERKVEVPVIQQVDRVVEVPQVQVVNKYVPKVEVKTIERVVPKTVVKTVERIQEVPVVEYKDKVVEEFLQRAISEAMQHYRPTVRIGEMEVDLRDQVMATRGGGASLRVLGNLAAVASRKVAVAESFIDGL